MRHFVALSLTGLLFLTACNTGGTLRYNMKLNVPEGPRRLELTKATERVFARRMNAQDIKGTAQVIAGGGDTASLKVTIEDGEAVKRFKDMIAQPFSFNIRVSKVSSTDKTKLEGEEWVESGITGENVEWVRVVGDVKTGGTAIVITLNQAGAAMLNTLSTGHKGEFLGIFVKDLLVSKMQLTADIGGSELFISGVPSPQLAEVFADDVNVGLKVQFSPANL